VAEPAPQSLPQKKEIPQRHFRLAEADGPAADAN
jgi:hypothetical protein